MGEIREEVESFYMRDYVEEKVTIIIHEHRHHDGLLQVETRLIEQLSLSDLV